MKLPICNFDAKNAALCPKCESKIESGSITKADADASIKLAQLAKSNNIIDKFTLYSCKEFNGNFVLSLAKNDIMIIRQSRVLYRLLQDQFQGKIWLLEADENDKKFIDLFFPTKILSINLVWVPDGIQKTKTVVSGKWTPRSQLTQTRSFRLSKTPETLTLR